MRKILLYLFICFNFLFASYNFTTDKGADAIEASIGVGAVCSYYDSNLIENIEHEHYSTDPDDIIVSIDYVGVHTYYNYALVAITTGLNTDIKRQYLYKCGCSDDALEFTRDDGSITCVEFNPTDERCEIPDFDPNTTTFYSGGCSTEDDANNGGSCTSYINIVYPDGGDESIDCSYCECPLYDPNADSNSTDGSSDNNSTDGSSDNNSTDGSSDNNSTDGSSDNNSTDGSSDNNSTDGSSDNNSTDGSSDNNGDGSSDNNGDGDGNGDGNETTSTTQPFYCNSAFSGYALLKEEVVEGDLNPFSSEECITVRGSPINDNDTVFCCYGIPSENGDKIDDFKDNMSGDFGKILKDADKFASALVLDKINVGQDYSCNLEFNINVLGQNYTLDVTGFNSVAEIIRPFMYFASIIFAVMAVFKN